MYYKTKTGNNKNLFKPEFVNNVLRRNIVNTGATEQVVQGPSMLTATIIWPSLTVEPRVPSSSFEGDSNMSDVHNPPPSFKFPIQMFPILRV